MDVSQDELVILRIILDTEVCRKKIFGGSEHKPGSRQGRQTVGGPVGYGR